MLLLQALPNTANTRANAPFRRYFYSKWGKEHCILSGRATRAEYPPYVQRLSIKAAWGGVEQYFVDRRRIAVDDDSYLILNDVREYASVIDSRRPVQSFSIFFRPGFVEEALGAASMSVDRALDSAAAPVAAPVEFYEHLRPHDGMITPVLRHIRRHADAGFDDEAWYEEQLSFLVERMFKVHNATLVFIRSLHPVRATTRHEIYRRVGLATDFMHGNYARALTIDDLAVAAHLSKFHFIRLFECVHGVTPYTYLQTKRAQAAKRLLETSDLGRDEIAMQCGFGHRSTMFRKLRHTPGRSIRDFLKAGQESAQRPQRGYLLECRARSERTP